MGRRRLTTIAAAFGLLAGLCTPLIGAQAASSAGAGNDNARCSGTFDAGTGTCTISQMTEGEDHSAVCVEDNTPGGVEVCVITQTSTTGFNNRAVVVQRYHQNNGQDPATCTAFPTANQCAMQTAHIMQTTTGGGSNVASVRQTTDQKLEPNTSGDQNQQDSQDVAITQTSDSGQNQADLNQSSAQRAKSNSGASQTEGSGQHGNINQDSTGLSTASARQDQDQRLAGTGFQNQTIDPRCCTNQTGNAADVFTIKQNASQFADSPGAIQESHTTGTCRSDGHCTIDQTATQNGASKTVHTDCTPGSFCFSQISCFGGSEFGTNQCFIGGDALPITAARSPNATVALRQAAYQASARGSAVFAARSAPSTARLT